MSSVFDKKFEKMSENLKRMARQYRENAAMLLERIDELKQQREQLRRNTSKYAFLNRRIHTLESLYAESMSVARYLDNYHRE